MREKERLRQIEERLLTLKRTYEELLPIWNVMDRKIKGLDLEIQLLVKERNDLNQGQLVFDEEF